MNPHPEDVVITAAYARLAVPLEPGGEPVDAVRGRMRQRSRRRRGVGAALTACLVAVIALGTVHLVNEPSRQASGSAAAGGGTAAQTGPLATGSTESCGVSYDRKTLRSRDWAADATVTEIGRGASSVRVTLQVHTWYRGGSGADLSVRLPSPKSRVEDDPPAYGVGTRLLLSGVRSGRSLVPWSCGFTRYYDDSTAAVWAQVFAR